MNGREDELPDISLMRGTIDLGIAESSEPILEIDAAIVHQFDMVARNTCIEHMRDHFFGIHMLCSAIAMANHHDVLHAQLEDRDEQGTDHTAEGVRDHAARIHRRS